MRQLLAYRKKGSSYFIWGAILFASGTIIDFRFGHEIFSFTKSETIDTNSIFQKLGIFAILLLPLAEEFIFRGWIIHNRWFRFLWITASGTIICWLGLFWGGNYLILVNASIFLLFIVLAKSQNSVEINLILSSIAFAMANIDLKLLYDLGTVGHFAQKMGLGLIFGFVALKMNIIAAYIWHLSYNLILLLLLNLFLLFQAEKSINDSFPEKDVQINSSWFLASKESLKANSNYYFFLEGSIEEILNQLLINEESIAISAFPELLKYEMKVKTGVAPERIIKAFKGVFYSTIDTVTLDAHSLKPIDLNYAPTILKERHKLVKEFYLDFELGLYAQGLGEENLVPAPMKPKSSIKQYADYYEHNTSFRLSNKPDTTISILVFR